jgi:hypothetical protein
MDRYARAAGGAKRKAAPREAGMDSVDARGGGPGKLDVRGPMVADVRDGLEFMTWAASSREMSSRIALSGSREGGREEAPDSVNVLLVLKLEVPAADERVDMIDAAVLLWNAMKPVGKEDGEEEEEEGGDRS